ncbi:MAG: undecaprenyl-diphosphate phosphatase [Deltaproteobacteria bacterium]|nr:undecaprenyl-diphosphate phosphatase [Deltaproteobacteria bacterium]
MNWWQALILGAIEGITEFLPVSSTGHLLVAQRLLGIAKSDAANAFAVVIQAGAILAVLGLYSARVAQIFQGLLGRSPEGARLASALVIAFIPAAAFGLAFDELIESYLFGPWPIVFAWAAGGLFILLSGARLERRQGVALEAIEAKAAMIVGVAQCAALWPGVSRSLATIAGALAAGLSLAAAVEFSFLLGLITLTAATGYKTVTSGGAMLDLFGPIPLASGFIAASLSAFIAVRAMVSWLRERGLAVFAWWRIGMALIVAAMIYLGWL